MTKPFHWTLATSRDFGRANRWSKARGNPVAEKIKLLCKTNPKSPTATSAS
jgi:hypothetical protein